MVELVYMSQAHYVFEEPELEDLLAISRKNNTERGITGILLYDGVGTFIQAIEGEPKAINTLFEIIKADPRHGDIQQLSYREISQRSFGDWKMGFKYMEPETAGLKDGFSGYLDDANLNPAVAGAELDSFTRDMLEHFREMSQQSRPHD